MKFSIIIPVYNVAPYLRECLDSVLSQTFPNWEAICVDDGSTDGSGVILEEYAAKDSRFRIIHQVNAGVSAARNAALHIVDGEWVMFLDADDLYAPYLLKHCSNVIKNHPDSDLVCFRNQDFFEDFYPIGSDINIGLSLINIRKENISSLVQSFHIPPLFCVCAYQRDIISDTRFKNYALGEDILFLYSVLETVSVVTFIDVIGYAYRQRKGSASHSADNPKLLQDTLKWRSELLNLIERSKKKYDTRIVKSHINAIAENSINRFLKFNKCNQRKLFLILFDALKKVSLNSSASIFQRVRANILLIFPWKWVMLVLCVLPLWLKRKGLHR